MANISVSIKKVDSDEKATGKAIYVSDIKIPNMLYAKTVRSPHQKAKIINRFYPELEEGYYIIDHTDIPGKNFVKIIFEDAPVFPVDQIQHYQEPIALIVGPDKEKILEILDQIKIEYEVETPNYEYTNSAIHYHFTKGNLDKVKNKATKVIEYEYVTGYQ